MIEYVKIFVEIPVDSEIYKKAVEFANSNKDLDLDMFSSPEKVLQSCLEFGSNPHILNSMDLLGRQVDAYRKKHI